MGRGANVRRRRTNLALHRVRDPGGLQPADGEDAHTRVPPPSRLRDAHTLQRGVGRRGVATSGCAPDGVGARWDRKQRSRAGRGLSKAAAARGGAALPGTGDGQGAQAAADQGATRIVAAVGHQQKPPRRITRSAAVLSAPADVWQAAREGRPPPIIAEATATQLVASSAPALATTSGRASAVAAPRRCAGAVTAPRRGRALLDSRRRATRRRIEHCIRLIRVLVP